jgi:putative transposase
MSEFIHKNHNVSVLLYHFVFPTKYRRAVLTPEVDKELKEVCLEIESRYEIIFLEIGTDADHVHFLIQSIPTLSPTRIATIVKSLTARHLFSRLPTLRKTLWGGAFWSSGYFVNSVGRHGDEKTISQYVAKQGRSSEFSTLYVRQLDLFSEKSPYVFQDDLLV